MILQLVSNPEKANCKINDPNNFKIVKIPASYAKYQLGIGKVNSDCCIKKYIYLKSICWKKNNVIYQLIFLKCLELSLSWDDLILIRMKHELAFIHFSSGKGVPSTRTSNLSGLPFGTTLLIKGWINLGRAANHKLYDWIDSFKNFKISV